MKDVSLFVDGSCRGNPGPGGYCAILQADGREKSLVGSNDETTNNRMELMGVTSTMLSAGLIGLQALKRPCAVNIVTDSQYVVTILRGGCRRWRMCAVVNFKQYGSVRPYRRHCSPTPPVAVPDEDFPFQVRRRPFLNAECGVGKRPLYLHYVNRR
ncbi:MAG: hypothetical protein IAE79_00610 [Anaerolinea sp.]|nr:hypothetical protein [Anaerolinea sp.]